MQATSNMSEMEGKVFKQTYHLDDESESESSAEDEYIQCPENLPRNEAERIIAEYKSSLERDTVLQEENSEDSDEVESGADDDEKYYSTVPVQWLKDIYDEDTNEEPKVKTIMYKTTYRTTREQQSSPEVSYDEDTNGEQKRKKIKYKTFTTSKEQQSSPEASYDDDTSNEPKAKKIRRYKATCSKAREQKSFPEDEGTSEDPDWVPNPKETSYKAFNITSSEKQPLLKVHGRDTNEEPKPHIRKMSKSCIELQPTPGAEFIKIPIPNETQRKFKQTYQEEWENQSYLKDWIQPFFEDPQYAYCKFCKCKLVAHKKSLRDHSNTKKHRKNAFDITGVWGGTSSKPANLTYLVPQSRMKTDDMLLDDSRNSCLNFTTTSIFNMRFINDPLLPIS